MATPAGSQDRKPIGYDKGRPKYKAGNLNKRQQTEDNQVRPGGKKRTREPDPLVTVTGPRKSSQKTKETKKRHMLRRRLKEVFRNKERPVQKTGPGRFTLTRGCIKVHGGVPIVLCLFGDPL